MKKRVLTESMTIIYGHVSCRRCLLQIVQCDVSNRDSLSKLEIQTIEVISTGCDVLKRLLIHLKSPMKFPQFGKPFDVLCRSSEVLSQQHTFEHTFEQHIRHILE